MVAVADTLDRSGASTGVSPAADRLVRRAAFFKRLGLFGGCGTRFEVARALTFEDHRQAYQLVHDCYVERGYIEPHPDGMRLRAFEAMPEMATFVAKADGRVIAVTSVLMDSPELGLPSDKAFGEEIAALRIEDRRVCEITNLAVDPKYRNTPVFSELTRCCLAHAMAIGYDDLFIAISPEHARFFEEVLLFEACGDRRSYSTDVVDIVVGKRLNLRTIEGRAVETDSILGAHAFLHNFYFAENPYHAFVQRWAIRSVGTFANADLLRRLFVADSDFFVRLTPGEIQAIRSRWGGDLFDEVFAAAAFAARAAEATAGISRAAA
jgi:ribosomal protein S18 acetylase RimI-like enzyme